MASLLKRLKAGTALPVPVASSSKDKEEEGEEEWVEESSSEEEIEDVAADSESEEEVIDEFDALLAGKKGGSPLAAEMTPSMLARRKELLGADSDESDWEEDEDIVMNRNTVGNIPLEWYAGMDHIGYNLKGEKILKPKTRDELEEFLMREEKPSAYWRTVFDHENQRDVVLSRRDMELLLRAAEGNIADPSVNDPYANPIPWPPPLEVRQFPILNTPAPKRRFVPSKWEAKRVGYLMRQIRRGLIKLDKVVDEKPEFSLLWEDSELESKGHKNKRGRTIPLPKQKLPGHRESYRPPSEFLLDKEEEEAWKQLEPRDRPIPYLPTMHDSLREVPAYEYLIRERYRRCLTLYLRPRSLKIRRDLKPEDLLPKLPSPDELRPFPTFLTNPFKGHVGAVLSISASPDGQWLASGGADATLRVWEVSTGRCMSLWKLRDDAVRAVSWHPNAALPVLAVAAGRRLLFFHIKIIVGGNIDLGLFPDAPLPDDSIEEQLNAPIDISDNIPESDLPPTISDLSELPANIDGIKIAKLKKANMQWKHRSLDKDVLLEVVHPFRIQTFAWHPRGDYCATTMDAGRGSVHIHRLSQRTSQNPFASLKPARVECVRFHPTRPYFFVATQKHVKVYNLVERKLLRRLFPGVEWISKFEVHPSGDHLIVTSYDRRVCWFDLDFGKSPYRKLRYHRAPVRGITIHPTLPLFASCSDDLKIHVFHGRVYNDLLQNALIVPVKILRGHQKQGLLGVTDVTFHPTQPWLFSAGADGMIHLYT